MTEFLDQLEKEFMENIERVGAALLKLDKASSSKKQEAWNAADKELSHARDTIKDYELELYEIEKNHRAPYELKKQTFEKQVAKYTEELKFKKPSTDREQLFAGRTSAAPVDVDNMDADQILQVAQKTAKSDLELLKDSNQTLEETKVIADTTAGKLQEQTEAFKRVAIDLAEVDDNVTRGQRSLKKFGQRMATDKCVWVLVLLILAALVFVIVWAATHPNSTTVQNPVATSPSLL